MNRKYNKEEGGVILFQLPSIFVRCEIRDGRRDNVDVGNKRE
jgi:hypothetical protein